MSFEENDFLGNLTFDSLPFLYIQEVPAFRDFRIRDPRYFVILFQASISGIPRHFGILTPIKRPKNFQNFQKKSRKIFFFWIFFFKITKIFTKLVPKPNHKIAGITNSEITKCRDLLYTENLVWIEILSF